MNNFYELLNVNKMATTTEIISAYQNKINKYNKIITLSNNEINEIKLLKTGLYILINTTLRNKYNTQLTDVNSVNVVEPNDDTQMNEINLDSLFNIDNSWMKEDKINNNISSNRKNNIETDILSTRTFSLSTLNRRPGFSPDFETQLRKPQQSRNDKSIKSDSN